MTSEETPMVKKPRENYGLSPESFVTIWQTSRSVPEAVERIEKQIGKPMPKSIILARASYYRRLGVMMKKMPRKTRRIVDSINNGA